MTDRVQEILPVKRAAEDELLSRPGVTAVDIGFKYVDGERTDEIVIRVHVAEKRDVPEEERIPAEIDGIPTDVIEGRYEPLADLGSYSPLKGGISIGPSAFVNSFYSGTLGAIVVDNETGDGMVLSNYHVLCVNEGWRDGGHSKQIDQPSVNDNPITYRPIATVKRALLGGDVDAAVARLDGLLSGFVCEVQEVGVLTGTADAPLRLKVRKRGRTTGLTYGEVDGVDKTVTIKYGNGVGEVTFNHQVTIAGVSPTMTFAGAGDSGSVVVDEHDRVVGLLFGGGGGGGTITPIKRVLEKMNVRLAIAGVGGFDLTTKADRVFALDFGGTGKLDHLALYRPGKGAFYLVKQDGKGPDGNGRFTALYQQPQGGQGIGSFDLTEYEDQIIAFDGASAGQLDHLLCYRPGTGIAQILKHASDQADGTPIYKTVYAGTNGIAGFDLSSTSDQLIAYDLESTGKLDHLVLYRPGKGAIYVVRRDSVDGAEPLHFTALYQQPQGGSGIGGFDLTSGRDRIIAFDAAGTGKLDHLLCYRPGKGIAFVLKYDGVKASGGLAFTPVYIGRSGIGGFDLSETTDQVIAFDFDGSGKLDHLVMYRPGTSPSYKGILFIVKCDGPNSDGTLEFRAVYTQGDHDPGLGGYELTSIDDQIIAFDGASAGKLDHLLLYRPGTGIARILEHARPKDAAPRFETVYRADGVS
ncbi:hypothetical protein FE697_017360 [Mumia zhuanghuii]|uniref:Uncharacterized protein n=2 Tax=Mumia TaxID=1546255 RepID=A0ABW1QML8_9ACTN|nr:MULTISPECIES: hypothetical protein [Mumia]KAA1420706.1 hypothetical protein FE697_017360 [Mumia zhuanghuii]